MTYGETGPAPVGPAVRYDGPATEGPTVETLAPPPVSGLTTPPTPSNPPGWTGRSRWRRWLITLVAAIVVTPLAAATVVHLVAQGRWAAAVNSGSCLTQDPATAPRGACVAVLRIPRFGADWAVPVYAATGASALSGGVGWYPGTTPPGAIGNCAIVGYRLGSGQPFFRLRDLAPGDSIIVETADWRYTYIIGTAPADLTVGADDSWVLNPVPGADLAPTNALLTLITAQDLWPSGDRSVGIAVLDQTEPR